MVRAVLGNPRRIRAVAGVLMGSAIVLYAYIAPAISTRGGSVVDAPAGPTSGADLDFARLLSKAHVAHGVAKCEEWTGNRWTCGLEPWVWVGRYRGRVTTDDGPQWRSCIWAHPHTSDKRQSPLEITFEDVELTGDLFGEAALLDAPKSGAPVELDVFAADKRLRRLRLNDKRGRRRWYEWRAQPGKLQGTRQDIRFVISTRSDSWRHVCFTAFMAGPQ